MHQLNRLRPRGMVAWIVMLLSGGASSLSSQTDPGAASRAASAPVKPGDRIDLVFRRDRELNSSIVVNERGEAVFPKLGSVNVAGLTIGELPDTLAQRYREYLRSPELDVTILRRIVVNGEVRQPNVYMVDVSSTVRDAIARAGGLLETANKNSVVIVRGDERLNVKGWDRGEDPRFDLQSGDQVVVGRKSWLVLNALPVISTSVIVIGLIRSLRN